MAKQCWPAMLVLLSLIVAQDLQSNAQGQESAQPQDAKNELWKAAREGDLPKVRALLDRGIDVNTRFRYGTTALFFACDRGAVDVVKLLLERGADPNVKDTFYGATPLTWALSPPSSPPDRTNHDRILVLLLEHGAEGAGRVLSFGVQQGSPQLVEAALRRGTFSAEELTTALSSADERKQTDIARRLREAGALSPPVLEAEELARHAGIYKNVRGYQAVLAVEDGKLIGRMEIQGVSRLLPVAEDVFRAADLPGTLVRFQKNEGKITGLIVEQGSSRQLFEKTEEK